jgi:hypothetical protein
MGREQAEQVVAQLRPGTAVTVYYDRTNPSSSVLVNGFSAADESARRLRHIFLFGSIPVCIAIAIGGVLWPARDA